MENITKIQEAILALPKTDYQLLRQWFDGLDKDEWEQQSEQEPAERETWYNFSMQMLARAYEEYEPEYTTDMLKWVNPDYEGK